MNRYFLQRFPGDALEVTVHADGGLHDAFDLLLAVGPLTCDGLNVDAVPLACF